MGEILGLTVSDFPFQRFKSSFMPGVLNGNLATGWVDKPHLRDSKNWPEAVQKEWVSDRDMGRTAGKAHHTHQIEQFRKLRAALDDFGPDILVIMHRDMQETFRGDERPQYWIAAHEDVPISFYKVFGFLRGNYHEEDPDRTDTVHIHQEGAQLLIKGLREAGLDPRVMDTVPPPAGTGNVLGHNCVADTFHLDWDKREFATPIIPIGIDPYRFGRTRNNEGFSTWDKSNPNPPLSAKEGWELGQHMARIFKASPWKVAIVAGCAWSKANGSGWEYERVTPDVEADAVRFEQWKNNDYARWVDELTPQELEDHGQWELLMPTILGGAMTEIGAKVKYADFGATLVCNDDWVTTIFEAK